MPLTMLNARVSPDLLKELRGLSERQSQSVSQLVRDALSQYVQKVETPAT